VELPTNTHREDWIATTNRSMEQWNPSRSFHFFMLSAENICRCR